MTTNHGIVRLAEGTPRTRRRRPCVHATPGSCIMTDNAINPGLDAAWSDDEMEPADSFRSRARTWLAASLGLAVDAPDTTGDGDLHRRARPLQRALWDGGFAGIRWPKEYGGLGLSSEHQAAFNAECREFEMPTVLNVPTFGILAATLVDFGTHDQKLRHLPQDPQRRRAVGAVPLGADRRIRPRGMHHPRRPRRRRPDRQRLEDLEFGSARERLRDGPRPHQLGGAEAPAASPC